MDFLGMREDREIMSAERKIFVGLLALYAAQLSADAGGLVS
jgi:hypothetical protein